MKDKRTVSGEQEQAIELCTDLSDRIVGVTGGAGTGKTFVLGKVHAELKKKVGTERIVLVAPTGRAAKRIQELTGIAAMTLHRLLQFPMPDDPIEDGDPPPPNMPRRHAGNPLSQRVVLVDEASMVSSEIYGFLMDALPLKSVVRFFGDNQQLAPVEDQQGVPPPFIRILEEEPSVKLTWNFRSQDDIVGNSIKILHGQMPQRNSRFEIIYSSSPIETLIEFVNEDFMQVDHQIIMPMRKNQNGTTRVNPSVQMRFNPKGEMMRLDRYDRREPALGIREGDKFLFIKNDYNLAVFNGEIGTVDKLDHEAGDVTLLTPDRTIVVPAKQKYYDRQDSQWKSYDPRKQIELGFAITTHKSQGSEFDTVVYCMSRPQYYLLSRRNFYTAVTRARQRVILITDRFAMGMSLRKKD